MNNKQDGIVLIISLIMLLLMTLLGISAMNTSLMEEKMVSNSRDKILAFEAAESTLRKSAVALAGTNLEILPSTTGSNGIWVLNAMDINSDDDNNWWQEQDESWWIANAISAETNMDLPLVKTEPRTVLEYIMFQEDIEDITLGTGLIDPGSAYYRLTARGTGGTDQAISLIQSTILKRY